VVPLARCLPLQRVGGKLTFVPPKTHRSARALPLSKLAMQALKKQRARQAEERLQAGEAWHDLGLAFASVIGTPMEPRNVKPAIRATAQPRGPVLAPAS
jgi:integrase